LAARGLIGKHTLREAAQQIRSPVVFALLVEAVVAWFDDVVVARLVVKEH
jgi:hypothetical protein